VAVPPDGQRGRVPAAASVRPRRPTVLAGRLRLDRGRLRELREETGLEAVELYAVDALFDLYAWKRGTVEAIVPFAALLASDGEPRLSEEHDDWRWESLDAALELVPFEPQRAALRRISADILDRPELAHLYRIEPPEKRR